LELVGSREIQGTPHCRVVVSAQMVEDAPAMLFTIDKMLVSPFKDLIDP
jgi:hypothetical protein